MKLVFSRHALERMEQRGITREYVKQALGDGSASVAGAGPGKVEVTAQLRNRTLTVVAGKSKGAYFVITAYWEE